MTPPKIICESCQEEIPINKENVGYFTRIQRGYFQIDEDEGFVMEDESNIKCELLICQSCYFTDPDLCAFFNRIGFQLR